MDTPKKVIVGCDLCDDFTQLCCYSYKAAEPVMIGFQDDEECRIPTILAFNRNTKKWLFGEDALSYAGGIAGVCVEHLLEKLQTGEEVEAAGQKYTPTALLTIYLQKALALVKKYFPSEPITKLVVTVAHSTPDFYDKIYESLSTLGLEKDRVWICSHSEGYLYYALSQEKTLWQNDIGLFDFSEKGLLYYQICMSRRAKPIIARLYNTDYSNTLNFSILKQSYGDLWNRSESDTKAQEKIIQGSSIYFKNIIGIGQEEGKTAGTVNGKTTEGKTTAGKITEDKAIAEKRIAGKTTVSKITEGKVIVDKTIGNRTAEGIITDTVDKNPVYIFENIANTALYKQIVTTIYITGSGFEGGWAEDAIKSLCVGRRVFFGQNLYAKGACYAARELSGEHFLTDVMLLSEDMVGTTVMLQVYRDAAFQDMTVIQADERWYEVNKNFEVIAEIGSQLDIILKNEMTRDIIRKTVAFEQFPDRPNRMTRLSLQFACPEQSCIAVKVTDLGFGDSYPGIGLFMEFLIEL